MAVSVPQPGDMDKSKVYEKSDKHQMHSGETNSRKEKKKTRVKSFWRI